jgi:hypothetical protein
LNAHEETIVRLIVELRRLQNIRAVLEQKTRDTMHDAGAVIAGKG